MMDLKKRIVSGNLCTLDQGTFGYEGGKSENRRNKSVKGKRRGFEAMVWPMRGSQIPFGVPWGVCFVTDFFFSCPTQN